jgi:hypothetical protein
VKTSSIGWATKAAAQGRSITRNSPTAVPSFDKSGEGGGHDWEIGCGGGGHKWKKVTGVAAATSARTGFEVRQLKFHGWLEYERQQMRSRM